MSNSTSKSKDSDGYLAIETALLASDRGRLFLAEYARRQRASGTVTLLDAICRLEDVIRESRTNARMKENLEETRSVIMKARREIATVFETMDPQQASRSMTAERLTRAMHLLEQLEGRVTTMITFWEADDGTDPPEDKTEDLPQASAAASLLRKLESMTPEERLALFR